MNSEYKEVIHIPVLLNEFLYYLAPKPNKNYIDATVNGGGMAEEVLKRNGPRGKLLGIDLDRTAIEKAQRRLIDFRKRVVLQVDNFANVQRIHHTKFDYPIDGIYCDLGMSSHQLADPRRGFSFRQLDAPLDMRFSKNEKGFTAKDLLKVASEDELCAIFQKYGEERKARTLAKVINEERKKMLLTKVSHLVRIVGMVYGEKKRKIHPATKVFQALRIAVNNELENLSEFLEHAFTLLIKDGRLVIISFHSLEDRIVKKFFRDKLESRQAVILTRKVITPSWKEKIENPRSRSARLRALVKHYGV